MVTCRSFSHLQIIPSTGHDLRNPRHQCSVCTNPGLPLLKWRWQPMCSSLTSQPSLPWPRRTWPLPRASWSGSQGSRTPRGASPPPRSVVSESLLLYRQVEKCLNKMQTHTRRKEMKIRISWNEKNVISIQGWWEIRKNESQRGLKRKCQFCPTPIPYFYHRLLFPVTTLHP